MTATSQIASKVVNHLNSEKDSVFNLLKELVACESPSNNRPALNRIKTLLENQFKSLNYYTFRANGYETGGFIYARPFDKSVYNGKQLLLGHCDTVWDLGSLKTMPLTEKNNTLAGPGIYDMKAGITQILFALKTIKELNLKPPAMPLVVINADEEIGSIESTPTIKRLAKLASKAFVMEPPLGLDGRLKTSRKGVGKFVLTITGRSAHAGLDPEKGINAIVELSHQIQNLFAMNDPKKGITVNVGMISGGLSPNVVAPKSQAIIDVRVNTKEDGDLITKKIKGLQPVHPEVTISVEGGIRRPPMLPTEENQALWRQAKETAKLLGLELEQGMAGGGSDGNTTSQFTATLDGLGTPGDGAHAQHEYILKDKLIERTALLTLLLLKDPI
ncbi:M20 family metallopeptidase [Mangrovimonas aestuarii]|uniref:M20 family metallopeptidase n=1 Tax=Mangrovimonas aestuarii TaxID=3018443 RepID=UPI002379B7D8|nr:M20 family metallopeptidase [Mangrovimonas aestuarii]